MSQHILIQLVVAWTFVGALIITIIFTLGSMVGLIKFADGNQQKKLFYVFIPQLVVVGVTFFGKYLNYSPTQVADSIRQQSIYDYWNRFRHHDVPEFKKPMIYRNEYRYIYNNIEGSIKYSPDENVYVETTQTDSNPAFVYLYRPVKEDGEYLILLDDSRNFSLKLPKKSGKLLFCGNGIDGKYTEFRDLIAL